MKKMVITIGLLAAVMSTQANPYWIGGKITSLLGSGSDPAIRLEGNVSPDNCDGGKYGWLYFKGSAQEKQWLYSTALAMAVSGKRVTVYTNSDGNRCEIDNIQVTDGLN